MSYENFKQKVWSKAIDRELERLCVFATDTNQKYTGEIAKLGDTVRIKGVGKPTVTTWDLTTQGSDITLSNPEKVADTSVSLVIDKAEIINYGVGDIDKEQGAGDVMSVLSTEASEGIANAIDKSIADLSLGKVGVQKYSNSNTVVTVNNVLDVLDDVQKALWENDVQPSTTVTVTMPPWFFKVLKQAYTKLDTDNSAMIQNGKVGMYSGMILRMSNNVATNNAGHHLIQVKTQRAIALAQKNVHLEPYRPESKFEDALKGFRLHGAKIVRPKEMITLECSAQ